MVSDINDTFSNLNRFKGGQTYDRLRVQSLHSQKRGQITAAPGHGSCDSCVNTEN